MTIGLRQANRLQNQQLMPDLFLFDERLFDLGLLSAQSQQMSGWSEVRAVILTYRLLPVQYTYTTRTSHVYTQQRYTRRLH